MIRRVRVRYRLEVDRLDDEVRQTVDRVMGFHARKCPVARTLEPAIDLSTEIDLVEAGG